MTELIDEATDYTFTAYVQDSRRKHDKQGREKRPNRTFKD